MDICTRWYKIMKRSYEKLFEPLLCHKLALALQARTVKLYWLLVLQTLVRMLVFAKRTPILRVTAVRVLLAGKVTSREWRNLELSTKWPGHRWPENPWSSETCLLCLTHLFGSWGYEVEWLGMPFHFSMSLGPSRDAKSIKWVRNMRFVLQKNVGPW